MTEKLRADESMEEHSKVLEMRLKYIKLKEKILNDWNLYYLIFNINLI